MRAFQAGLLPVVEVTGEVDAAPQRFPGRVPLSSQGGSAGFGSRSAARSARSARARASLFAVGGCRPVQLGAGVVTAARAGRAATSATWSSPSRSGPRRASPSPASASASRRAGRCRGCAAQSVSPSSSVVCGSRHQARQPSARATAAGVPFTSVAVRRLRVLFGRVAQLVRLGLHLQHLPFGLLQPLGLVEAALGQAQPLAGAGRRGPASSCAASRSTGNVRLGAAGRVTGCGSPSRCVRTRAEPGSATCSATRISSGSPAAGRPASASASRGLGQGRRRVIGRTLQFAQGPPGVADRLAC